MPIRIRDAEPKDDTAVGELLVRAFVTKYGEKMPEVVVGDERKAELRAVADKRRESKVLVAEVEGRIAGTVALFPAGAKQSEAWLPNSADLRHLAVGDGHRGQGISTLLLDETERIARAWGVDHICLHVRRGAKGIAALYMARGYLRDSTGDLDLLPAVFLEAFHLPLKGAQ